MRFFLFEGSSLLESSNSIGTGRSVPFAPGLAEQPDLSSFLAFLSLPWLVISSSSPIAPVPGAGLGLPLGVSEFFGDGVRDA